MPDLRNWGRGRSDEQTYTYHTPDGKTLDVKSDHPLSADEVRQVFKAAGVDLKLPDSGVPTATGLDALTRVTSNMSDGPAGVGERLAGNSLVQGAAHPQGLGDILSMLLPNYAGQSLQLGGEAMSAGAKAHPELGPIRSRVAGIIDRWKNVQPVSEAERAVAGTMKADIPLPPEPPSIVTQPAAGKMLEQRGRAPVPPASTPGQPDVWDQLLQEARQGRKPQGPAPVLRKGSAPNVSDVLRDALDEAGAGNPSRGTTPPPPTTTPMGKPSITAEQYAQGERAAAAQPKVAPRPSAPAPKTTGKADKFAEIPDDPAVADIADRLAGGKNAPSKGNGTGGPKAIEDAITELRRKYGANRIGKTVNPKAPEAGTGSVLRADASKAPSAMPDMAQKAVLRDLRAGTSNNPAATARAIEQLLKEYARNKGPANSDVARELADLLQQHGFKTGIE